MKNEEKAIMQYKYIDAIIKYLPVLRAATSMTQAQLAEKIGVSRQTIVSIETRKRPLPWSLYLALICIFQNYSESKVLLESYNLFDYKFIHEIN
jgi:DNA-binding XRE family transcriptional regulator